LVWYARSGGERLTDAIEFRATTAGDEHHFVLQSKVSH